jgi:hypothetical protein
VVAPVGWLTDPALHNGQAVLLEALLEAIGAGAKV